MPRQDLELVAGLLRLDQAATEISDRLGASGIGSILLKGPTFARWLYDIPRQRLYTDVDILVPAPTMRSVRTILAANGYRPDSDHPLGVHFTFYREDGNARVEIHSSIVGVGVDHSAVWPVMERHIEPLSLLGRRVNALDVVGRSLHVALHAASDGEGHPLEDLSRALALMPEDHWSEVLRLADELDARASFVEGLRMDRRGVEVLSWLGLGETKSASVRLRSRKASNAAQLLALFAEANGTRRKWRVFRRAFFPSPELMRQRYAFARKGRPQLWAMYLVRGLASPLKALASVPAWRRSRP